MSNNQGKYLAFSGGIGGAKLVLGLSHVLSPAQLTVVANTGDDFEHIGLYICPDIDTLIYTLADINNQTLGWGRRDETWNFLAACRELDLETWFRLGDKDLAIHLYRTNRLKQEVTLSAVIKELCVRFNVQTEIIPMSDDPVRTVVTTDLGRLPFQEYFVKHRCAPRVSAIEFTGAADALPAPKLTNQLDDPDLHALIICPSNPFLSIQPILAMSNLKDQIKHTGKPVVVVSPIVQGQAIKGPTAKLMDELKLDCNVTAIAGLYAGIADGIVIDRQDEKYAAEIESTGMKVYATGIIMNSLQDRINLANEVINFSNKLAQSR